MMRNSDNQPSKPLSRNIFTLFVLQSDRERSRIETLQPISVQFLNLQQISVVYRVRVFAVGWEFLYRVNFDQKIQKIYFACI